METVGNPSMEKIFKGLKYVFQYSGMWPPDLGGKKSKSSVIFSTVAWVNMIMYATVMVSEIAYIIKKWPDFDEITSTVTTFITCVLTFIKMTTVYAKRERFCTTISTILHNDFALNFPIVRRVIESKLDETSCKSSDQKSRLKLKNYIEGSLQKKSKEFAYVFWLNSIFISMTLAGYCIPPACKTIFTGKTVSSSGTLNLPFKSYMPFDTTSYPGYYITYFLHVWASFTTFTGCAGGDILVCAHVMMTTRQFEIVSHILDNLEEYSGTFMTVLHKEDGLTDSDETGQLSGIRDIMRKYNRDFENTRNEIFNQCVEHSERLMRFIQQLNSIFGLVFISQLLISSIQLCLVLFKYKTDHNPENKMTYLIFIGASLCQLFLYCWYGQSIINVSSAISDSIYGIPWYCSSINFRRSCVMVLRQSQRTLHLSALGFSKLSLTTMTSICSAAVSYYTLLDSFLDG